MLYRLSLSLLLCWFCYPMGGRAESKEPQAVRKDYWVLVSLQAAALIGDVESTKKCIDKFPEGRELNPFLPRHPSRTRMYVQAAVVITLIDYAAYRLERAGHRRWARLLQTLPIGMNLYGFQNNARLLRQNPVR